VGALFSVPVPETQPASSGMGNGSFPGVNGPGRGVDHLPHSIAEVATGLEL
jgi:hypothetical protein